jgi:hypothetical protein
MQEIEYMWHMYWLLMTKYENENITNYFKDIPLQLQISHDANIIIEIAIEPEIQQINYLRIFSALCRNSPHGSPHQSYLIRP